MHLKCECVFSAGAKNFDRQNIIILSSVIETYLVCLASARMRKYAGTYMHTNICEREIYGVSVECERLPS